MYVVGTPINFTIDRPRNASALVITHIRVVKPDGDIDEVTPGTNTTPGVNHTGSLAFSHNCLTPGLYRFEILSSTSPYMLEHSFYISAVSEDTTYNTTVDM
jgi:hypothetical protein